VAIELNDDQRLRAERLAREKGEKCPRCGSSDLRCGVARADLGRYTLPLTFSEEVLFFSVPLSPDSPFLVVVSALVPPL
jgi:hypothetical protein